MNLNTILFLTICATSMIGCGQIYGDNLNSSLSNQDINNDTINWNEIKTGAFHYKTKDFDVAIFSEDYNGIIEEQERFSPTKNEVLEAEEALNKDLAELNFKKPNQSSSPVIHENLKKYKRQYFGYFNEKGEKILFINCFWNDKKDTEKSLLNGEVRVFDGGSYFWQVEYNLTTKKLFNLQVNGYA